MRCHAGHQGAQPACAIYTNHSHGHAAQMSTLVLLQQLGCGRRWCPAFGMFAQAGQVKHAMQGPEIRTGFLANGPVKLTSGREVTLTTDYEAKGTEDLIACRCTRRLLHCCAAILWAAVAVRLACTCSDRPLA